MGHDLITEIAPQTSASKLTLQTQMFSESNTIVLEHKGYIGHIQFDDEADTFHGEVINTRDVITFQGDSVKAIKKAFIESVEDYLAFCAERNEAPEKPFSGRFNLRLEPDIHRDAYLSARKAGMSLNSWVKNAIIHAVHNVSQSPSRLPGLHKSR